MGKAQEVVKEIQAKLISAEIFLKDWGAVQLVIKRTMEHTSSGGKDAPKVFNIEGRAVTTEIENYLQKKLIWYKDGYVKVEEPIVTRTWWNKRRKASIRIDCAKTADLTNIVADYSQVIWITITEDKNKK